MLGYLSGGAAHSPSRAAKIGIRSCVEEAKRRIFMKCILGKSNKKHPGYFFLACVLQSFHSSETFLLSGIPLNNTNLNL